MALNRYDVIAKVRQHFIVEQNPFAVVKHPTMSGTRCLYRGESEDGRVLQCAVGCLIPAERYREYWEGSVVAGLYDEIRDLFEDDVDLRFLGILQGQHDEIAERVFEGKVDEAAARFEFGRRLSLIEDLLAL